MNTRFPSTLLLVPTELERQQLEFDSRWLDERDCRLEIAGFGVIASAVVTTRLLTTLQPDRALLVGIAGSYRPEKADPGSAAVFSHVALDGIGAIGRSGYRSAAEMGFATTPPGTLAAGHGDSIPLHSSASTMGLLTVTAASMDAETARQRHEIHPDCLCEDMEGYAVACACAACDIPLTIVRGISNVAGDRDKTHWRIRQALAAARSLIESVIDN